MSNKPHKAKAKTNITKISATPSSQSDVKDAKEPSPSTTTNITKITTHQDSTDAPVSEKTTAQPTTDDKTKKLEKTEETPATDLQASESIDDATASVDAKIQEASKDVDASDNDDTTADTTTETETKESPDDADDLDHTNDLVDTKKTPASDTADSIKSTETSETKKDSTAKAPASQPVPAKSAKTTTIKISDANTPAKSQSQPASATSEKPLKDVFILFRPFVAFGRYLRDSWRELRQVRWPNRKVTWKMTVAVLIYCAIFFVFILALDAFFTFIFELILA